MEKRIINLTVFLIKGSIQELDECLKSPQDLNRIPIKDEYGLDGYIYISPSNQKPPKWRSYLEALAGDCININDNASNKAILLARVNARIVAVVFGYGRSFIKENCIERNFGFKVALNVINPNKMRSVNAATIEDMVVTTQRQASYSTDQEEFGLNITNDIMKGLTGEPYDDCYGKHISGKDSLVVSVSLDLSEIKDKLALYVNAFSMGRYREIGFGWVDNIGEVRDSDLSKSLQLELSKAIQERRTEHLHIAPPESTDWERIIGFCYSGIGKKLSDASSYNPDLDLNEYIEKIGTDTDINEKIKTDRLYAMNSDETHFSICNIYSALVFQTLYDGNTYILCAGNWYLVNTSFYNNVHTYVKEKIPASNLTLPACPSGMDEGKYNEMVANETSDFCLMDKKMISVEGGPKQIEACDIFTKAKQLIHVKNKGKSSQLSHLFSQGRVSAQCFMSDESFRKQVLAITEKEFSEKVFNSMDKPNSNEFEIVYAIIDNNETTIDKKLPFFSLVNLMITAQDLDRMHFKYSVCLVKRLESRDV